MPSRSSRANAGRLHAFHLSDPAPPPRGLDGPRRGLRPARARRSRGRVPGARGARRPRRPRRGGAGPCRPRGPGPPRRRRAAERQPADRLRAHPGPRRGAPRGAAADDTRRLPRGGRAPRADAARGAGGGARGLRHVRLGRARGGLLPRPDGRDARGLVAGGRVGGGEHRGARLQHRDGGGDPRGEGAPVRPRPRGPELRGERPRAPQLHRGAPRGPLPPAVLPARLRPGAAPRRARRRAAAGGRSRRGAPLRRGAPRSRAGTLPGAPGPRGLARRDGRLRALSRAHGFEVVVLAHPEVFGFARDTARELGFPLVETGQRVRAWAREQGIEDVQKPPLTLTAADPHPSAVGHEIIAQVLADSLRASGMAARLAARRLPSTPAPAP